MTALGGVRKFVVALAGAASVAVADGIISGTALKWTTAGIAVATAITTYLVPNSPPTPAQPPPAK